MCCISWFLSFSLSLSLSLYIYREREGDTIFVNASNHVCLRGQGLSMYCFPRLGCGMPHQNWKLKTYSIEQERGTSLSLSTYIYIYLAVGMLKYV